MREEKTGVKKKKERKRTGRFSADGEGNHQNSKTGDRTNDNGHCLSHLVPFVVVVVVVGGGICTYPHTPPNQILQEFVPED